MTKSEKAVDTAILLFTPFIDMVKFSKQLNNLGNEYYLVTQNGRQYLAVVTDEYIERRELPEKIIDRKNERFEIGNFKFVNA